MCCYDAAHMTKMAANPYILREIYLAISDKAGCLSDLLTEWGKFYFCQVGISSGVLETQNLKPYVY